MTDMTDTEIEGLNTTIDRLETALDQIVQRLANCPCMSLQVQREFDRNPDLNAYKVELALVIIEARKIAKTALADQS